MTDLARLVLDADTRGLKKGQAELDRTGKSARGAARDADKGATSIGRSFAKIGVAAAGAFAASGAIGELIGANARFGQSMSRVGAISGATGAELQQLKESAMEMGNTTEFSASQAADALGFLSMAGFQATESIAALPAVLNLATASGMGLAESADIASNVLSGFGKNAADAANVADVLAEAASSTNTSVGQLGQAMSTAAPIARSLGVSMEETAAAIGVMSDAGIQGERAGTALRGVFASLAGPTTQAQQALAKYGLTAKDIDPQTVGLAEAMGRLDAAGISTADAMQIFGREAASGALVMAGASERVKELTAQFVAADGAAAEMAETMRDNLQGDIDAVKSAFEGLLLTIGDAGAAGGLRGVAQSAATALRTLSENLSTITTVLGTAVVAWASYKAAVIAANVITGIANSAFVITTTRLLAMTGATAGASAAQSVFAGVTAGSAVAVRQLTAAMALNPIGLFATAIATAAGSIFMLGQRAKQARAETAQLIGSLRGLAEARSADFAQARYDAQIKAQELREEKASLEAQLERQKRVGSGRFLRNTTSQLSRVGLELVGVESKIKLADQAFEEATKSAEEMDSIMRDIEGSTGGASGAISGITSETTTATTAMQDFLQSLSGSPDSVKERLDLARAAFDQGTISAYQFRMEVERANEATRRFEAIPNSEIDVLNVGMPNRALYEADMVLDAAKRMGDGMAAAARKVGKQTTDIAESFATMAQNAIQSLQGLISSIKGGGFLDILGSVLGLMGALGIGGSGSKVGGLLGAIGGLFGKRADGGAASSGRPYLVGERGPELFIPRQSGSVVPNDRTPMGGGITVNVDARGAGDPAAVEAAANRAILAAAPQLIAASEARTVRTLQRPRLQGLAR